MGLFEDSPCCDTPPPAPELPLGLIVGCAAFALMLLGLYYLICNCFKKQEPRYCPPQPVYIEAAPAYATEVVYDDVVYDEPRYVDEVYEDEVYAAPIYGTAVPTATYASAPIVSGPVVAAAPAPMTYAAPVAASPVAYADEGGEYVDEEAVVADNGVEYAGGTPYAVAETRGGMRRRSLRRAPRRRTLRRRPIRRALRR